MRLILEPLPVISGFFYARKLVILLLDVETSQSKMNHNRTVQDKAYTNCSQIPLKCLSSEKERSR